MKSHYQVIIGGAGPAGLAASLTLSTHGISHCLVDANENAVQKLGDALPPNANPLLEKLGITTLLKSQRHIPYYGNKSSWGTPEIHEKEFIEGKYGHGHLLDRRHFEHQLRLLVESNDTPFYRGYQLKKVQEQGNFVEAIVHKHGNPQTIQAEFIMDATGRKASISRHLGGERKELDTQIAIAFVHQSKKKIPRQICIEAVENGWWYLSPSATNEINCMFFTLKGLVPKSAEIGHFLAEELRRTIHVKQSVNPNEKELSNNRVMPAGTSRLLKPYGKNWLALGDAAFAYDPISSYGMTSALASGYYGAYALAAKLDREDDAFETYRYVLENGAESYMQKLVHQYESETRWKDSYYWKNRLNSKR